MTSPVPARPGAPAAAGAPGAPSGSAVTSPVPGSPSPPAGSSRGWTDHPVFSLVRVQIRDERAFGDYLAGHLPTIGAFGGRFLAAGALPQPVEGDWPMRRMIVHQWPSAQVFFQWYESTPYSPWRQIRQRAADTEMVLVQGIASSAPAATQRPALVVIDVAVRDSAPMARYAPGHMPGLRAAGGEFLVAGGHFQVIEGQWEPRRLLLQRWPSAAAFRAWYDSAAYRPWRELRWSASQADMALLEGLSEAQKSERRMP
ncbi:MAG: DUF1330 domain-containing protein [Rubrivivax sp.]|nr:DUF1330 domain-containing protein [Rubrivivax sp.]